MCGVAGFLAIDRMGEDRNAVAERMARTLRHRGPDSHGVWHDREALTLVHTRLAIVDLSKEGHQPMRSYNGRYVIAFNGEFYNHADLRPALADRGVSLRGNSDTEVFIEMVAAYGLQEALGAVAGMFAIALYDRHERRLHLIRDRFGEKPLYYAMHGRSLIFGSELKAMFAYPGFRAEISDDGFHSYLKYNCIPAPLTIYKNAWKVQPAEIISFDADTGEKVATKKFWNLDEATRSGHLESLSESQAADRVEEKLSAIVAQQLRADVPVGCFLSGGIDSSLIAVLAQKGLSSPLRTFTIGFEVKEYNEAPSARQVARHIGADHQEWIVKPTDILAIVPSMPEIYDEPFADASQLPTTLLSQLTRRAVTVCLSGDGGDELFGGYNRYLWTKKIWSAMRLFPNPLNRAFGAAIESLPPGLVSRLNLLRTPGFASKVGKVGALLGARSKFDLYDRLLSCWIHPDGASSRPQTQSLVPRSYPGDNLVEYMMREDARRYLTDDIMVKVDRASMSVALESRAPYLHHELFELAWTLPLDLKIRGGVGKYILRKVLARYVPEALWARPKSGFAVPLDHWFRHELSDWIQDLLSGDRLLRSGFYNAKTVHRCLDEHQKGIRNWQYQLWNVVMFQAWYDRWMR